MENDRTEEVSAAEQAKIDALKDMMEENEAFSDLKKNTKIQFIGSYMVESTQGPTQHGVIRSEARSMEEAIGRIYLEISKQYDVMDGWLSPSIVVDPTPCLVIPGVQFPITSDSYGDDVTDNDCCGTCGNPEGPCLDPDTCELNNRGGSIGIPLDDDGLKTFNGF